MANEFIPLLLFFLSSLSSAHISPSGGASARLPRLFCCYWDNPSCRSVAVDSSGHQNLAGKFCLAFSGLEILISFLCGVLLRFRFVVLASCLALSVLKEKAFEFFGGGEVFPLTVAEFSRRKRFFVRLCLEEFHWLAIQWDLFCSSKRDPL